MTIQRVTMFKVREPLDQNIPPMFDAYKILAEKNSKDGKPYILEIKTGRNNSALERSRGYTFVAMTRFDTLDDMKYYDSDCPAHKEVKTLTVKCVEDPKQPPMTVYFEEAEDAGRVGAKLN